MKKYLLHFTHNDVKDVYTITPGRNTLPTKTTGRSLLMNWIYEDKIERIEVNDVDA